MGTSHTHNRGRDSPDPPDGRCRRGQSSGGGRGPFFGDTAGHKLAHQEYPVRVGQGLLGFVIAAGDGRTGGRGAGAGAAPRADVRNRILGLFTAILAGSGDRYGISEAAISAGRATITSDIEIDQKQAMVTDHERRLLDLQRAVAEAEAEAQKMNRLPRPVGSKAPFHPTDQRGSSTPMTGPASRARRRVLTRPGPRLFRTAWVIFCDEARRTGQDLRKKA
jgi:hypothetical protein